MLDTIMEFLTRLNDGSVDFINELDTIPALLFGGSLGYLVYKLIDWVRDTLGL